MSSSDSYWRVKELFSAAMEKPSAERADFLRDACAGDQGLFDEVRAMLDTHERTSAGHEGPGARIPSTLTSPSEVLGETIGPYKLLKLIGEGGMGLVYKAEQRSPVRRIVALKLIKLGMDTRQVIARFEAERQALAVMNPPNVAAVHDAGATDAGRPYFVMEYVPGTPITSFCDRHKYTTRQRLGLFMQACDAIQHAHTKAIIHRDVKPGNILVTLQDDHPVVKIIDFGV